MIPTLINCTCCIIKPHAIRNGNLGKIIRAITAEKYVITTMKMIQLDNASAAEFYEVYKGVVPDYMVYFNINSVNKNIHLLILIQSG